VIRVERSDKPIAGTSSAAAAEFGIPSITAEAGGRGIVEGGEADGHVAGVRRILGRLVMLPVPRAAPPTPPQVLNHFLWKRAERGGWWEPSVQAGDKVDVGQRLGTIESLLDGDEAEVLAPRAGCRKIGR